jgi:hypothetical protein
MFTFTMLPMNNNLNQGLHMQHSSDDLNKYKVENSKIQEYDIIIGILGFFIFNTVFAIAVIQGGL